METSRASVAADHVAASGTRIAVIIVVAASGTTIIRLLRFPGLWAVVVVRFEKSLDSRHQGEVQVRLIVLPVHLNCIIYNFS